MKNVYNYRVHNYYIKQNFSGNRKLKYVKIFIPDSSFS